MFLSVQQPVLIWTELSSLASVLNSVQQGAVVMMELLNTGCVRTERNTLTSIHT